MKLIKSPCIFRSLCTKSSCFCSKVIFLCFFFCCCFFNMRWYNKNKIQYSSHYFFLVAIKKEYQQNCTIFSTSPKMQRDKKTKIECNKRMPKTIIIFLATDIFVFIYILSCFAWDEIFFCYMIWEKCDFITIK